MKKEAIEKLRKFIEENPPLDKDGEPRWWVKSSWKENLDKEVPEWRELLKSEETWREIKGVRPRRDYDDLLKVILEFAPSEILKEYLTSEDSEERRVAYDLLIEHNARKLTTELWKVLDRDTKIWLISKIFERVSADFHSGILKEIDILLHDPEYFFERYRRRDRNFPFFLYPTFSTYSLMDMLVKMNKRLFDPQWIKLKETVRAANDSSSFQLIEKLEQEFMDRVDRLFFLYKSLLKDKHGPESKNVMFDVSLLLDIKHAKRAFRFMEEHEGEFMFFISASFYEALQNGRISKLVKFFGDDADIEPEELLKLLERYRHLYTLFGFPHESYERDSYHEKYRDFYESLKEEVEDRDIRDIIFEEWVFLQEFSWIVARTKNVFEAFKKAGAVSLEVSKKAFYNAIDKLVRRSLGKMEGELTIAEKLRGLGKWIGRGVVFAGTSLALLSLSKEQKSEAFGLSILSYLASDGLFVLIDPEEIA